MGRSRIHKTIHAHHDEASESASGQRHDCCLLHGKLSDGSAAQYGAIRIRRWRTKPRLRARSPIACN